MPSAEKGLAMPAASSGRNSSAPRSGGPPIIAPPLWHTADNPGQLLTDEERAILAENATVVRFRRGESIYNEGDPASSLFSIISGVVKLTKVQPGRKEHITEFMFPNDLIGLAQKGQYVNSAKSVTATALYRMPTRGLEARFRQNPGLEFHIITKLCQYLGNTERHALLLAKNRTNAKLGLVIQILETHQNPTEAGDAELYLPMSRADIAAYAGISPEAVSRGFADLVGCGAIAFRGRSHLTITDRAQLQAIIAETDRPRRPPTAG
jgi:CRP/FNR family transcriptional regulator, anaerobic regulatory protein